MRIVQYVLEMLLGIAIPLALQLWDRRRLDVNQRERMWNSASWAAALYAFGPFSMLGWFWVTRRSFWALLVGVASVVGIMITMVLVDYAVAMILGLPAEAPWKVLLA
jgi:hypothetical protein